MKRRVSIWLAVLCAFLVVTAAPAAAATETSINTTDADFADGTLTNLEISGTGTGAQVVGSDIEPGTVSLGAVDDTQDDQTDNGLLFSVDAETDGLSYSLTKQAQFGAVELRYNSNGTLIESVSPGDDITATLVPSETYRLVADTGNSVINQNKYQNSYPLSDGGLTVENGYANGATDTTYAWNFESVSVGPDTIEYVGDPHVVEADSMFADFATVTNAEITVTAQRFTSGSWSDVDSTTITTAQNVTLDTSAVTGSSYRIKWTVNPTGTYDVAMDDEGAQFTSDAPVLSNPDPADGASVDNYDGSISIDVNDTDFGDAHGDVVTIVAENQDGTIDSVQTNQNGTVSIDYAPRVGANNITWTATDEYGLTDTLQANFTTPNSLIFVNETSPSNLVTSPIEIEVQFINETSIVTKTTTTGSVSFDDLPADESFIVTVEPSQSYFGRTVYLESLLQQRTVYLLSQNVSSVETRFTLEDQTGQFSNQAIFSIQKPINESGTTTYKTIHSDRFGVEGVTIDLEEGQRYRTSVESVTGVTQDTGPYRADVSETVVVRPGDPTVPISTDNSSWDAGAAIDNQTIEFRYADAEDETDKLVVWVHERGDESNQLGVNRTYFNLGEVQGTYTLTANQSEKTWVVKFIITRGGGTFEAQETVANRPDLTPDLDREWRLIFGIGLLLISAGVFSVLNASIGGVVVALEGGLLWWTGWLGGATTGAAVVLALFIAIMMHLYTSRV